ncbi:uracil-DNA glycosylase family protein [Blastomonas aquatica]|nr:hypothetical protein [Blastomonas aquatica]
MNSDIKLAQSLVDWWQIAGVTWDFHDTPNDWLADDPLPAARSTGVPRSDMPAQPKPLLPAATVAKVAPPPVAELILPEDLAAFQQAWREGTLGLDGGDGVYLAPSGPKRPRLMVVTASPERDDRETVLSGIAGTLIDNIARAAGFAPDSIYRGSFFPRLVLDSRAAAEHVDHWRRITLHHIGLVKPEMLVVAGGETARALLGHDPSQKPPILHFLNHGGRTIKVIVMRKPGLMLHRIVQEKAMAWQSWQLLLVE